MLRSRGRRRGLDDGAAAVEFALVSVVLFPLLFGIIDYALWFNDASSSRQAVREAGRLGVVQLSTCSSPAAVTVLAKTACQAVEQAAPVAGSSTAMVKAPDGWTKSKRLVVCVMTKETGTTGITPLPSDGTIRSRVQMSIEVDEPAVLVAGPTVWPATADASKFGWCT